MKTINYDNIVGKCLSENRIKSLQNDLGYLDNFITVDNEVGFVTEGNSTEIIHFPKTQSLILLNALNKEREKLIEFLMS